MVAMIVIGLCLALAFISFGSAEGWAKAILTVVVLVYICRTIERINPPRRQLDWDIVVGDQAEKSVSFSPTYVTPEQD